MVWTGNAARQPAFKGVPHRVAPAKSGAGRSGAGDLTNADRVMKTGLILPCNHGMDDADIDHIVETSARFLAG
jgi:CDP-6-deoxy-D-xylo-4-hexulose-3-dehydrase